MEAKSSVEHIQGQYGFSDHSSLETNEQVLLLDKRFFPALGQSCHPIYRPNEDA